MLERLAGAVLLTATFAAAVPPQPQAVKTGPQLTAYHSNVDGTNQPYALYIPKAFDPNRRYPLVLALHEEDANHRLCLRRVFGLPIRSTEPDTDDMRLFAVIRDVDYIVACPFARGTMGYQGVAERDVYDVLADVQRRYPVDPDRIYLTGMSMGGAGALRMALTRPDLWAAVGIVCPMPLSETDYMGANAANLPIRLFHGDQDPLIPVASTRALHRKLLDLGVPVDYVEYPGVRHNAWDVAYRNGAMFDWFSRFRRTQAPNRVHFTTASYRYSKAYWLEIDALTPGMPTTVDATVEGGEVRITTQRVEGFHLNLASPVGQVTVDGTRHRVKPSNVFAFNRRSGEWRPGRSEPFGKRPGAEGPIVEAVAGRHIYVYGTIGAPTAEELAHRRQVAERAARWSATHSRLFLALPVKADTEVTAEDLDSADLVLFGTAATNSLIARFSSQLPLSLNPGAADYGLLFIAPVGRHYALINSGLPWWTGAEEANRGGPQFAPEQLRLLATFGDYILFKGSLAHVVAEGRFDSNWKVPPEVLPRISAAGTINVR